MFMKSKKTANTDKKALPELSPELRFLVLAACRKSDAGRDAQILELYHSGLNPEVLTKEAEDHRLYSIVSHNLKRLGIDKDPVFTHIMDRAKSYTMLSFSMIRELVAVMKTLQENGIEAVLIKGPILAQMLYGNVTLRPSKDLDILIQQKDFRRGTELLEAMGYENVLGLNTPRKREYFFSHPVYHDIELRKGDVCVELHWRANSFDDLTYEELTDSRETMTIGGLAMKVPERYSYAYYLFGHAARHGFARYRWLMDLYEILLLEDWPSLEELYAYFRGKRAEFIILLTLRYMSYTNLISLRASGDREEDDKVLLQIKLGADERRIELKAAVRDWKRACDLMISSTDSYKIAYGEYSREFNVYMTECGYHFKQGKKSTLTITRAEFTQYDIPDRYFFVYYILRIRHWLVKESALAAFLCEIGRIRHDIKTHH